MTPKRWALNVLVVLDIAVNVVVLCSHDVETLSRRAARARQKGKRWGCVVCRLVDRLFASIGIHDHCKRSLERADIG